MRYLNASKSVKTFYGVKFNPGESHDVPGYINVPGFIRVADLPKEPPKAAKTVNELPKQPAKPVQSEPKQLIKAPTTTAKPEEPKAAEVKQNAVSGDADKSENSTT